MTLSVVDLLATTLKDLRGSWVRSTLTAIGIFMGVAAVNATLNISAITSAQIQQKINERDRPFVVPWIRPLTEGPRPELTDEDYQLIEREIPGVSGISFAHRIWTNAIQYQGESFPNVDIWGVSENFQAATGRRITQGRFFQVNDFERYLPVVVVDEALAERLFGADNPLGQGIYFKGVRFNVVGVSETKKQWAGDEPTGELWLTLNYAEILIGGRRRAAAHVGLQGVSDYLTVQEQLKALLESRYPNMTVYVGSNVDDLYAEELQQRNLARTLMAVGILSLAIGGVGIANITVAAVMERTREIGLRRAIGATDLEVMAQFIMEAVILSLVAGGAAVITVHLLTQVATTTIFEAPYQFSPRDAAISMTAALMVGVGASFVPALRVTQIDVVQALRGE